MSDTLHDPTGVKPYAHPIILVARTPGLADDAVIQYGQSAADERFTVVTTFADTVIAVALPFDTPWALVSDGVDDKLVNYMTNIFGARKTLSKCLTAYNDLHAISPKLLDRP